METLQRNSTPIRMRNYGRIIEQMVQVAADEKDEATREKMAIYIARSMRQKNMIWNKDQEASIQRIKEDIRTLSDGRLTCDYPSFDQEMQQTAPRPQQNNNQRKKRNNQPINQNNQTK